MEYLMYVAEMKCRHFKIHTNGNVKTFDKMHAYETREEAIQNLVAWASKFSRFDKNRNPYYQGDLELVRILGNTDRIESGPLELLISEVHFTKNGDEKSKSYMPAYVKMYIDDVEGRLETINEDRKEEGLPEVEIKYDDIVEMAYELGNNDWLNGCIGDSVIDSIHEYIERNYGDNDDSELTKFLY